MGALKKNMMNVANNEGDENQPQEESDSGALKNQINQMEKLIADFQFSLENKEQIEVSKFYERLPQLFPHTDAMSWFVGNEELIQTTAFRNGTLQGAYFMMAARALGLDCGPISGFDNAMVDAIFFPNSAIKSNFICSIGYGNDENLYPRSPRLNFDEACRID